MPERSFSITAATPGITLDTQRKGTVAFTVTNSTSRLLRGQMQIRPLGETKAEWLRLQGAAEINFAPSETHQVAIEIQAPPGTPPGKYRFRLDACSTSNPDDDYTEGPVVSVEMPVPPAKTVDKKPFPLWILLLILGIVVIGGLTVWLLVSGGNVVVPDFVSSHPRFEDVTSDKFKIVKANEPFFDGTGTVLEGRVTKQDPEAGAKLRKGGTVTLSVQPPLTKVPQIAGGSTLLDLDDGALLLLNAKLDLIIKRQATQPAQWGKVLAQNPAPGTVVPQRTPVTLAIGSNRIRPDKVLNVDLETKFRLLRTR